MIILFQKLIWIFFVFIFPFKKSRKKSKNRNINKIRLRIFELRKSLILKKTITPFSQSRKNTIDEEEEMKNNKNNYKQEGEDQFKEIFTDKVNSWFFSAKKEIISLF